MAEKWTVLVVFLSLERGGEVEEVRSGGEGGVVVVVGLGGGLEGGGGGRGRFGELFLFLGEVDLGVLLGEDLIWDLSGDLDLRDCFMGERGRLALGDVMAEVRVKEEEGLGLVLRSVGGENCTVLLR